MLGIVHRVRVQVAVLTHKYEANTSDSTRKENQNEVLRAIFVSMVILSQSLWKFLSPRS